MPEPIVAEVLRLLDILTQILTGVVLGSVMGFMAWTIAKEEIFRPIREVCKRITEAEYSSNRLYQRWLKANPPPHNVRQNLVAFFAFVVLLLEATARKICYIPTCEYCSSVWIGFLILYVTKFSMLYEGWRGYVVAEFFMTAVANIGMRWFSRQGVENDKDKKIAKKVEQEIQ